MLSFELLQAYHDRQSFSCGTAALDDFLRVYAHAGPWRTWVLVEEPGSSEILTYCALEPDPVECISEGGLHLGNVDVVWVRYLATASKHQRRGHAELMLNFAIESTVLASEVHPIEALMLDPISVEVQQYYLRLPLGFRTISPDSLRLAIPMSTMRDLVSDSR